MTSDAPTTAPREALYVGAHRLVHVVMELERAEETVRGRIAVAGSPPSGFYGWLELMDRLEEAAADHASDSRCTLGTNDS